MSEQTSEVRRDVAISVDPSVFNIRAFGAETLIDTDVGCVSAGELTLNHRLRSLNSGYIAIDWVRRLHLDACDLQRYPDLTPVLILAGQFRPGVPRRNIILSPSQRIWTGEDDADPGVFGSANALAEDPLSLRNREISVSYIVVACSRPAFLRAEGIWVSC